MAKFQIELIEAMKRKDETVSSLARKLSKEMGKEISRQQVFGYWNGEYYPKFEVLIALRKILGMNLNKIEE